MAVSFTVAASGAMPLAFQWQTRTSAVNAVFQNVPGATAATLTLPNPGFADSGTQYRAVVTGPQGSLTSGVARLVVINRWQGEKQVTSNGAQFQRPTALTVDRSGNVIAVGTSSRLGEPTSGLVTKINPSGTASLWSPNPVLFQGGLRTEFNDVATDIAGDVYVVGVTSATSVGGVATVGSTDALVLKLAAANGALLWARNIGSAFADGAQAVAVDVSGAVYVAGYAGGRLVGSSINGGGFDAFVAKFDGDGNRLWLKQFGGGLADAFISDESGLSVASVAGPAIHLGLDGSGNAVVAVTGQLGTVANNNDVFVVRFNPGGEQIGTAFTFGLRRNDRVGRVAVAADGSIVVAGITEGEVPANSGSFRQDAFVVRLGVTGAVSSQRVIELDPTTHLIDAQLSGLALDAQGNAYVAMHADIFSGARGVVYAKVDPGGTALWSRAIAGDFVSGGVVVDSMGRLFIARENNGMAVRRADPQTGQVSP